MKMNFKHLFLGSLVLIISSISLVIVGTKTLAQEFNKASLKNFIEQFQSSIEAGPLAIARLHASDIAQEHLTRLINDTNKKLDIINEVQIYTNGFEKFVYATWERHSEPICNKLVEKKYNFPEALNEFYLVIKVDTCKPSSNIDSFIGKIQKILMSLAVFLLLSFTILFLPMLISLKNGTSLLQNSNLPENKRAMPFVPVRDIVQLALKSKDLERDIARIEITKQVAHDIRSPIHALRTAIGFLETHKAKSMSLIHASLDRIEKIIEDLQRNKKASKKERYNLVESIHKVVEEKQMEYPNLKIVIHSLFDPYYENIDSITLSRFISNTINNSVEASASEVILTVEEQTEAIIISIQDNGFGIPEEILSKIGQKGFSHNKQKGQGLGLSHIKEQLSLINGSLNVISKKDKGTIVQLALPKGGHDTSNEDSP